MITFDRVSKPAQRLACALIAAVFLIVSFKDFTHDDYKHGGMNLVTAFTYGLLAFKEPLRSRAATLLLIVLAVVSLAFLFAT